MFRFQRGTKQIAAILLLGAAVLFQYYQGQVADTGTASQTNAREGASSGDIQPWQAGQWILVQAEVTRILGDDRDGSRHQRFIIELPDRQTLLVAHNIDLAERVPVQSGDSIKLRGRFEPNDRGGVVHWTHHDPDRAASAGWIEHRGRRYE